MYIQIILEKKLLSPNGIILRDNGRLSKFDTRLSLLYTASKADVLPPVFARGITIGKDFNPYIEPKMKSFWEESAEALKSFNKALVEDPRIDVVLLPLFDGVTQIKWSANHSEAKDTVGAARL